MTTLVGWLATQRDGPTSIYLASESRITWPSAGPRWDAGRKLFALRNSPDLFGYCGDAFFPSQMLGQITEIADHGLLFAADAPATDRHERVVQLIRDSLERRHRAIPPNFAVVHVARDDVGKEAQFRIWCTTYAADSLSDRLHAALAGAKLGSSRRLLALGTGAEAYIEETIRWDSSDQAHTSRGYFTALCDVVARDEDPGSGGVPQLVGLYREGNGRGFGIIMNGRRYFHGLPVDGLHNYRSIEWRDDAFQRMDGRTLKPLRRAQRQVRPALPPRNR